MDGHTLLSALAGGILIGLSAALLLLTHKRTAGISGIVAGIFPLNGQESHWRLWFLGGLILSAPVYQLTGLPVYISIDTPLPILAAAGLLVGYGTRLGGGCTSGHGICGIAKLSLRSFVATLTFMFSAGLTVFIVRHF